MSIFGPPDVERLEQKRDVDGLVKALGYRKDSTIRMRAGGALGRLKDVRAVEPLMVALGDEDVSVGKAAAGALGEIGDPRAIKSLAEKLASGGVFAAAALGSMRTAGFDELISNLNSPISAVRAACATSLGSSGDKRAILPLIYLLADPESSSVRKEASRALDKLGWTPDSLETEAQLSIAKEDWGNCAKLGSAALVPLIAALNFGHLNANYDERDHVAQILGQIGDRRAVQPLLAALVDPYPHYGKCQAIASALVKIGDLQAVPALLEALNYPHHKADDWNVGHFAEVALKELSPASLPAPAAPSPAASAIRNNGCKANKDGRCVVQGRDTGPCDWSGPWPSCNVVIENRKYSGTW